MDYSDSKFAIIGGGAMGGTLAETLVVNQLVPAECLVVSTPHPEKCARLSELNISVINDNVGAVKGASIAILAVKPWIISDVIKEIGGVIDHNYTEVAAIVAGVSSEDLENMWPRFTPRNLSIVMPNTAMAECESMTFIVPVTGKPRKASMIFKALGKVIEIPEEKLGAATALASCGIAYAMRYVRAATEGGVELGFGARDAQDIVVQTIKGAAALLSSPGSHPEVEIDKVTTPGGLTIRGLNEMERCGFSAAVIAGLKASAG